MNEDKQRIAELEKEVALLKQAVAHNNTLIVGLERAFLDVVHTVVEDNDDLAKSVLSRLEADARQFDPTAYKKYRHTVELGNADTQLDSPAGLLSRYIVFDMLSFLDSLKN